MVIEHLVTVWHALANPYMTRSLFDDNDQVEQYLF